MCHFARSSPPPSVLDPVEGHSTSWILFFALDILMYVLIWVLRNYLVPIYAVLVPGSPYLSFLLLRLFLRILKTFSGLLLPHIASVALCECASTICDMF
jgi:hypothetical protein